MVPTPAMATEARSTGSGNPNVNRSRASAARPKVVATTRCGPVTSAILEARSPPMMAPPLSTNRNESEPFALYPAFSMILGSQVFSP